MQKDKSLKIALLLLSIVVLITIALNFLPAVFLSFSILLSFIIFIKPVIGLYLLALVIPLSPKFYLEIFGFSLELRIEDALLVLTAFSFLGRMALNRNILKLNLLIIPFYFFILIASFSSYIGAFHLNTITSKSYSFILLMRLIEYFLLYLLVFNIIEKKSQIITVIFFWLVGALIASFIGIGYSGLDLSRRAFDGGILYVGQANHMGGYLMITLLLIAATSLYSASGTQRMLLLSISPVIIFALMSTYSRTSWLGFIMAFTLLCAIKSWRLLMFPVLMSLIFFLVIPYFASENFKHRVLLMFDEILHFDLYRDSFWSHIYMIREVIRESFDNIYLLYFGNGLGYRLLNQFDSMIALLPGSVGIVGTVSFLWFALTILYNSVKTQIAIKDTLFKAIALAYLVSFFAVIIHGTLSVVFFITLIMEPFWLLAGLAYAAYRIEYGKRNA